MTEDTKDAEIGRMAKQYAEAMKTIDCVDNALRADADKLLELAHMKGLGKIGIPEGLDLEAVGQRLRELNAAVEERARLERCLEQAGLDYLVRKRRW